jgi:hypothetical protein
VRNIVNEALWDDLQNLRGEIGIEESKLEDLLQQQTTLYEAFVLKKREI